MALEAPHFEANSAWRGGAVAVADGARFAAGFAAAMAAADWAETFVTAIAADFRGTLSSCSSDDARAEHSRCGVGLSGGEHPAGGGSGAVFSRNSAYWDGGAVYARHAGAWLDAATFLANRASAGGSALHATNGAAVRLLGAPLGLGRAALRRLPTCAGSAFGPYGLGLGPVFWANEATHGGELEASAGGCFYVTSADLSLR